MPSLHVRAPAADLALLDTYRDHLARLSGVPLSRPAALLALARVGLASLDLPTSRSNRGSGRSPLPS